MRSLEGQIHRNRKDGGGPGLGEGELVFSGDRVSVLQDVRSSGDL